jgi:hypothetical protein
MSAFVGTRTVASAEELRSLLEQHQTEKSCFFLRWPHRVSGFCKTLPPDFPSPEGQLFDSQKELRWQPQGQGYSVLLLSASGPQPKFEPVGGTWEIQAQDAHLYPKTETRFPQGINNQQVNIGQRYFIDPQTATVHFVALKVS